ncbi:ATP-binding protein [Anaeromyxobacter terrae]|uniref:ATP-binding protein n=1 Tax=Anaeromyxobacter terrae TaxID=2925406 RepID=UPI001F568223|nr:DUF4062 domain-containing protein [Anaeromyxobacter sp. SG22]
MFISSTLGELAEERRLARAAVDRLRLTPVMFELGARPHPPRALYQAYLAQSHVFVGIYWQRYGWIAPGETVSGVEDEYDLSGDRPKLIYVKEPRAGREPRLEALLARMERDARASYKCFSNAEELGALLEDDLATLLSERFESSRANASTDWEESTHARLPEATTTFVGREEAIRGVRALLRESGARMVTLTGPGGIGKTRLALQVARGLHHRFRDGVVPVFLGALAEPSQVVPAMCNALGLAEIPGVSRMETLVRYLHTRKLLLVLDNFEHVIAAAPELTALLAACPRVRMLVTSRELLKVAGERGYEVPPLEVSGRETEGRAAAPSEAARLFVERAASALPGFALTPENAPSVAEICRKLEGLPLALELAAARVRVLPLDELADRLEDRLGLLVHGPRDMPERHRTLRAALEWSHGLLGDSERKLFARLAVFRGGWTLSDAEAVCGPDSDVLEGMSSLLDKSLIRGNASGAAGPIRFAMLETIREFASEQLRKRGEEESLRTRHAEHFLDWAERSYVLAYRGEAIRHEVIWTSRIDDEAENLRAAMRWLADRGRSGAVARMGLTLWRYWWVRSEFTAAAAWMQEALASGSLDDRERALAQLVLGIADVGRSEYEHAVPSLAAAQAALDRLGDEEHAALAAVMLGTGVALTGDATEGERIVRRALTTFQARDDVFGAACAMFGLGRVLLMQGRLADAAAMEEEGAASLREAGEVFLRSMILVSLSWTLVASGRFERAIAPLQEALEIVTSMQNRDGMARVFEALGAVGLHRGHPRLGALLFGAAEGVRRSVGARVWVLDRVLNDNLEGELRRALGTQAFEAVFAEGVALPPERAIQFARAAAGRVTASRAEATGASAGVDL